MLPDALQLLLGKATALAHRARRLPRELFGDADPFTASPYSELRLLEPSHWIEGAQTLTHLLLPALPRRLPPRARYWSRVKPIVKPVLRLFLRSSAVYRYQDLQQAPDPSPDQSWFFLNGIGTDRRVLNLNAAYLSELFGRPLTLLHNPSCGLFLDLAEVSIRRDWRGLEEAARSAFAPVYAALKQPQSRRVVLIAHSQGTIVASVLLSLFRLLYRPTAGALLRGAVPWPESRCPEQSLARRLAREWQFPSAERVELRAHVPGSQAVSPPLSREELSKLELYCFANCAGSMEPVDSGLALPYIESYANEHDPIGRLDGLANDAPHLCGERYVRPEAWGHLLNAHYLQPMEREWLAAPAGAVPRTALQALAGNRLQTPRLFGYFGGASPPARDEAEGLADRARAQLERMHWIEPPRLARAG